MDISLIVHADDDNGDLKQGIALGIETTSFDIDHNRNESAETLRHSMGGES